MRRGPGRAAVLAAGLSAPILVPGAEPAVPQAAERRAVLVAVETTPSARLDLAPPVIVDRIEETPGDPGRKGRGPRLAPRITALEIAIRRASDPPPEVNLAVVLAPPREQDARFATPAILARAGETIRIPLDLPVAREREGPWTAVVRAASSRGDALFEGTYRFGYPRYTSVRAFERVHDGAPVRDGFDSSSIDERRWRIWLDDPERVRIAQEGGRLTIRVEGQVGYNGLVSRTAVEKRDVEVVCTAGVAGENPSRHPALVHLCGSAEDSPDNWFEVRLQADGAGGLDVSSFSSAPLPPVAGSVDAPMPLPPDEAGGHLIRIVSDAGARLVRGQIHAGEDWLQVGPAIEVPARAARLEIKTEGFRRGLGATTLWFDDCRLYPRAATHDVTIRLERPGGGSPGAPGVPSWPLALYDADNAAHTREGIVLRLFTEGGGSLVQEVHPGGDLEYATFSLEHAPWETYPAAALVRVFVGGRQLGGDLQIPSGGVEGLYPDDVWLLTLE